MIKQLLLLIPFFITCASATTEYFLLPDQAKDACYYLQRQVNRAVTQITIITPKLEDTRLRRALKKAAAKGVNITLASHNSHDAGSYLVQFKEVEYYLYTPHTSDTYSGNLSITLLLIDHQETCWSSTPLSTPAMQHDMGMLQCSDDPALIRRYHDYARTILERSTPYLK